VHLSAWGGILLQTLPSSTSLDYQNSILIPSIILLPRWVNKMIEEDETRLVLKKILKIEVGARFKLKLKLLLLDCLLI
jgi:hypothetical protein